MHCSSLIRGFDHQLRVINISVLDSSARQGEFLQAVSSSTYNTSVTILESSFLSSTLLGTVLSNENSQIIVGLGSFGCLGSNAIAYNSLGNLSTTLPSTTFFNCAFNITSPPGNLTGNPMLENQFTGARVSPCLTTTPSIMSFPSLGALLSGSHLYQYYH